MTGLNGALSRLGKIGGIELLMEVDLAGSKVLDWASEHQAEVEQWLQTRGAILLRGLNLKSSRQFGQFISKIFADDLLPYTYRSTPRTELRGNVYTTTEYHADLMIVQHNEQAYTNVWAMRAGFFCMLPADTGGETPIADSRVIYQKIPLEIRDKFAEKGVMYVRNYSELDLPWTEVFSTEDPLEVESYCNKNNIHFEWLDNNGLRTQQVLPAISRHPVTNELLWFNQAHLFHISALDPTLREELLSSVGQENLPRNSYYGDGTEIEVQTLEIIRDIYQQNKVMFSWQKGDLMLLDNMLYSHGRQPFTGERKVLVGMARPHFANS